MRERLEADLIVLAERLRDQSLVGIGSSNTTAMQKTIQDIQRCLDSAAELQPRLVVGF